MQSSKERIKNPILGAFLISFIVFNWKPIFIVLFASQPIQEKINQVEVSYSTYLTNIWLPLAFALFYVLILPYIMLLFDKMSKKALEGRKNNILNQKLFDYESKKQLAKKESELEDERAGFRDTANLNKKIDVLTRQIEERDETINTLQKELNIKAYDNSSPNDNTHLSKEEYESFKKSDLFHHFKSLGTAISKFENVPRDMDTITIEKFKHSDIIREVLDEKNQKIYYKFTKKGILFWKEFVLNSDVSPLDNDLPF
ncbi:hypothetical protein CW751_00090 [Brumimicrobium salinarum]|uniref:Uncharacterized protein n=2 Tax=Brumimicrobium salinarum TaxID=2058658 RepID=A0A2I0R5B1_9FLAO|nr:hypothetical protein CW751_00090 [Brumimicrobium salinarum]